jgi:hypothetical protein
VTGYVTEEQAGRVAKEMLPEIEAAVGSPCVEWGGKCHAISLAVLRTGLFGPGRVARGITAGPTGQHSWIVLGDDPYEANALIVDPTVWWYRRAPGQAFIHVVRNVPGLYIPNGAGNIWDQRGAPPGPVGEIIRLKAEGELSGFARSFLGFCGPLDHRGWMVLANAPVEGWPAREIIEAIADDPQLGTALIPIDVLGMLTSRNPGGLYW